MEKLTPKFDFSIIIPTYMRYEYVLSVIGMLENQSIKPLEVLIIDASPTEKYKCENFSSFSADWLKYIPVNFYGNISKQRNIAIPNAKGDILLFLDDDVIIENDLLENYRIAFTETVADGICGIILDRGNRRDLDYMKKKRPVLVNPCGINLRYANFVADTHVISTANFACKKEAIKSVGGFDEQLYGTIEDVELGIRLVKAGFKIIHHYRPVVNHLAVKTSGSRSSTLGKVWNNSNLFYFQMKHHFENKHKELLIRSIFDIIRPSRTWLKPTIIIETLQTILPAFQNARTRINQGPRYMYSYE